MATALQSDMELRQEVATLRKEQRSDHGLAHIGGTYALLLATFWAMKNFPEWWVLAPAWFMIGFMQYRLVMSTHEAVHKTLVYPVWLNEFFGVFHSALVGISFFNYRKTHLEHHKNPQSIDEDIDSYIYRPLLEAKPGFPRFFLLVFGVLVDVAVKIRRKLFGATRRSDASTVQNPTPLSQQLLPVLICQAGMIAFFTFYLKWWYYPIFWMAPVVLIALSLDRARTFLEHGYQYIFSDQTWESFKDAPQATIDVDTNPIERFFFAPYGFAYHQAHHTYLTVPFYNLPRLANLLESRDEQYFRRVRGSYVMILVKMIWARK